MWEFLLTTALNLHQVSQLAQKPQFQLPGKSLIWRAPKPGFCLPINRCLWPGPFFDWWASRKTKDRVIRTPCRATQYSTGSHYIRESVRNCSCERPEMECQASRTT